MSENLRESISALVDDEAQELELHRVLTEMEKDEALRNTWKRYQVASFSMKRKMEGRFDLDVSSRVSAALQDELPVQTSKRGLSRFFTPVLSMGVAASAAFLVIFAVQIGGQHPAGQPVAAAEAPPSSALVAGSSNPATADVLMQVSSEVMSPVEKRLQSLIESHTQQASLSQNRGVMPHTQLVEHQEQLGY